MLPQQDVDRNELNCECYKLTLARRNIAIASPSLRNLRRTPSQLHSQQRIPTQHDMLPQHHVYRNELNCECYNLNLARRNIAHR
jgi:hypothetical protein